MWRKLIQKIYSYDIYHSEKNDKILVRKIGPNYYVRFGNIIQSGPYMNKLWRKSLKKLPKNFKPKTVLLLGLGLGGGVLEILRRYAKANIWVVEYDDLLIDLAQKTYLQKISKDRIRIIKADAEAFLQTNQQQFDLIMVDLFKGSKPAAFTQKSDFIANLKRALINDGCLLMNFYLSRKSIQPNFDAQFSCHKNFSCKYNKIGLYRHWGQGNLYDPAPLDFQAKEQSAIFLQCDNFKLKNQSLIEDNVLGSNGDWGIFASQKFVSSKMPALKNIKKASLIIWQPLGCGKIKGWWQWPRFKKHDKFCGVVKLDKDNYWQDWSEHAQRHRKKWLADQRYEIVETDIAEFETAYHQSKRVDLFLRSGFMKVLKHHLQFHPKDVHIFVARNKITLNIIAGLAIVNYADISQSCHFISFISKEGKATSVGTGVIDYWYKYCQQEKIKYLNWGRVWTKGDPSEWKGYSEFKKQFNIYQIGYQRPFYKIKF